MDAFETTLKRAFAEAHEPVEDGFTLRVGAAVKRREAAAHIRSATEIVGMAAGVTAVAVGVSSLTVGMAPDLLSWVGLELARAHGSLANTRPIDFNAMGAGLTQALMVLGALAGGAAFYRNSTQR